MTKKETGEVFHPPPLAEETLDEDPEYAWSRKWVILNTAATGVGAVFGLAALVIAVIALTS